LVPNDSDYRNKRRRLRAANQGMERINLNPFGLKTARPIFWIWLFLVVGFLCVFVGEWFFVVWMFGVVW